MQIGHAFLAPYDLNDDKSTFTALGTTGPVHQALQDLPPDTVQVYQYIPYSPAGSNMTNGSTAQQLPGSAGTLPTSANSSATTAPNAVNEARRGGFRPVILPAG